MSCVLELDNELGALVSRHIAYLVGIDGYLRFGDGHRTIVDDCSGIIELGLLLFLVDAVGRTRLGKEDVRTIEFVIP